MKDSDAFEKIYDDANLPVGFSRHEVGMPVTETSQKFDDGIHSLEDKAIQWQRIINHWRIVTIQNERFVTALCVIFGLAYAYMINKCTGDFNIPNHTYIMTGFIVALCAVVLISEGELPLVTIVKYLFSIFFGHGLMMFLIAVDGHTFRLFTVSVCRYPITEDMLTIGPVAIGMGYVGAKVEEVIVSKRKSGIEQ